MTRLRIRVATLATRARLAALAATLLPLAACSGTGAPDTPSTPPVPVRVATVAREPYAIEWHGIGTVESLNTVAVRAQVGGVLERVRFVEGEEVAQGAPLLEIDARPLRAALGETESRLARDQALARDAQANVQRYADLVAKDYVTRSQYDSIVANAEALRATVAADEAAIESTRLELAYASIRAPIAGRTGALLVQRGNVVKANDVPLLVLSQMAPIRVTFALPEQYLQQVRPGGLEVLVAPAEGGGQPISGKLTFVDNAVSASTGTIQAKATFDNLDRALWPGQYVSVTVRLSTLANALVVPAQAVQTGQNGDFAFVVKPDQTVEMRPLKIHRIDGDRALVDTGLEAGEQVVVEGQLRLVPGGKVEVKSDGTGGAEPKTGT